LLKSRAAFPAKDFGMIPTTPAPVCDLLENPGKMSVPDKKL